jgi:nucleolar protein 4
MEKNLENLNTSDNKLDSKLKSKQAEEKKEKDDIKMDTENNDEIEDGVDPRSSKFLKRGRLFIRNLPFSITEQKLRDLFSPFGEIKDFNLPYDERKKMLKGFCFIQYETKKEALIAIKQLNGKTLDRRQILIEIAKPKNEYVNAPLPKIEMEDKNNHKRSKSVNDKNDKENSDDKANAEGKNVIEKEKKSLENDPTRTLFVRNLGFDTDENSLKGLFSKYGKLKYCLICRNKETKSSKGSGFIMFEKKEDLESVLKIYDKYETNKDYSGINPFELEGRNLKLFRSISKNDAVKSKEEKKENKENTDNRNRELLYYGLNNYYDFVNKDEVEVSEDDKNKREGIIQLKKTNFKKNPNLHVSETRLVLRNLEKTFTEEKIKEMLREKTEKFMELLKKTDPNEYKIYMKVKKIKQVKLMKDDKNLDKNNNPKSKNVAFVEVCDKNFAKWMINNLSNTIVGKGKKKGLIVDFCLDDFRKIRNRLIKLDKLKLINKEKNKDNEKREKNKDKKDKKKDKSNKAKIENDNNENDNDNENKENAVNKTQGTSIDQIKDVEKLAEMYKNSISRGKRQRIRKRIIDLGHSVDILGKAKELNFGKIDKNLIQNKNTFFDKNNINNANNDLELNENKINKRDSYTVVRIDNEKDNMNYNKKIKQNLKDIKNKKNGKNEDKNLLNKKKGRNTENIDNKNDKNKNKFKKDKPKKLDRGYDEEDEMQMSGYIEQIEKNLRKGK